MHRLAIFASGAGSNAANIIDYFSHHDSVEISLVVCNKPGAGVLDIARRASIPSMLIEKERFFRADGYLPELDKAGINFIVLAGFLWKIPDLFIERFPGKMVNIHPALLPLYGGKGMYGHRVHEAVIEAGDSQSGITIHLVDGEYDHGKPLFQASCPVLAGDTPGALAARIHELEYQHYPRVIEELLNSNNVK